MLSRRWARYVALLLLIGMLVPTGIALVARNGDDTPSAAEQAKRQREADRARCSGYARSVARQVQTYVSRFDATPGEGEDTVTVPSVAGLREQVQKLTSDAAGSGCEAARFRRTLSQELAGVRAQSPLGAAVAGTLVANARDVLEATGPRTVRVAAGDDLAAVFASVPTGSTVVLGPGRFRLADPLVVLQDVTVRGAGQGRSTVVSTSAEAAVVQVSPVLLRLQGLTLEHSGREAASVLVLRDGDAELADVAVAGGSTAAGKTSGDAAVPDLAGGGNGVITLGTGTLTMRSSVVRDSDAGGVVVAGRATPRLDDVTVSGNRLCGVCFLERSTGSVRDATVRGNGVGVIVGSRARPTLRDSTVSGNDRAGVVVQERARPRIVGNRVRGNGVIGIAVYGRAQPLVRDNDVSGHRQVGVVVSTEQGGPQVVGNRLVDNGQAALAFLGASGGAARANVCRGGAAGVVVGGTADPDLSDERCPVRDERAR